MPLEMGADHPSDWTAPCRRAARASHSIAAATWTPSASPTSLAAAISNLAHPQLSKHAAQPNKPTARSLLVRFSTNDPPPPSPRVEFLRAASQRRLLGGLLLLPLTSEEEVLPAMEEVAGGVGKWQEGVNRDCPNAANPFHRCAEYCPVPPPRGAAKSPPPPSRSPRGHAAAQNGHGKGLVVADTEEAGERWRSGGRSPARGGEDGAGGQWRAVNPDCPNADNAFHRCAEYCPVPAPRAVAKSPPPPPPPRSSRGHAAAQNGTAHGDGAERVVAGVADLKVSERRRSATPQPTDEGVIAHVADPEEEGERTRSAPPPATDEGVTAHVADAEEGERRRSAPPPATDEGVTAHVADAEEPGERRRSTRPPPADDGVTAHVADVEEPGERRRSPRPPATGKETGEGSGGRQWQAVNPDCPNAANPFHRCAEYCPVPVPRGASKLPLPPGRSGLNERTHSDGDLHPRPRRRDKGGGSGGLPLYVFLREGSDGDGKKVDPRCPNAPNPFHVCTDNCLAKIADAGRSSEGGKSPISLFSRHSRRSSSSSEEGSVKSTDSRKVDPKCPNAGNPFHECGEYCAAKMQQVQQQKGTKMKSPRKKGKDVAVIQNWKVDPRCPNASNPFHICAQYCFDHLSETTQTTTSKSDKKKGKVVSNEQLREVNPDCVNASNPYHKCGEHCKRKGDR